jgi:hypothetical protein
VGGMTALVKGAGDGADFDFVHGYLDWSWTMLWRRNQTG